MLQIKHKTDKSLLVDLLAEGVLAGQISARDALLKLRAILPDDYIALTDLLREKIHTRRVEH